MPPTSTPSLRPLAEMPSGRADAAHDMGSTGGTVRAETACSCVHRDPRRRRTPTRTAGHAARSDDDTSGPGSEPRFQPAPPALLAGKSPTSLDELVPWSRTQSCAATDVETQRLAADRTA